MLALRLAKAKKPSSPRPVRRKALQDLFLLSCVKWKNKKWCTVKRAREERLTKLLSSEREREREERK